MTTTTHEHHAYDYDAQRWIDGPAAKLLRLAQIREELDALASPDYVAFVAPRSLISGIALTPAQREAWAHEQREAYALETLRLMSCRC